MSDLHIPGTQSTPAIQGDWQAGRSVHARQIPTRKTPMNCSARVIDWVERFLADGQRPLELTCACWYLNTSSIKATRTSSTCLEEAHQGGRPVSPRWHYDRRNERVAELAEEFREDCSFLRHPGPRRVADDEPRTRTGRLDRRPAGRSAVPRGIRRTRRWPPAPAIAGATGGWSASPGSPTSFQSMAREQNLSLSERYHKQLRRLERWRGSPTATSR
ncbi:SiaC family regulatory phosphoprotein [Pseudomonas aeruginosa]